MCNTEHSSQFAKRFTLFVFLRHCMLVGDLDGTVVVPNCTRETTLAELETQIRAEDARVEGKVLE